MEPTYAADQLGDPLGPVMVIVFLLSPYRAASTDSRMTARWYSFLPERMDQVISRPPSRKAGPASCRGRSREPLSPESRASGDSGSPPSKHRKHPSHQPKCFNPPPRSVARGSPAVYP